MVTRLGTTTCKNRNNSKLEGASKLAKELNLVQPVILEFGPGGAVKYFSSWLDERDKCDSSISKQVKVGVIKALENIFRKTNLFDLESFEPEEVVDFFKEVNPSELHIYDGEKKVIDSVKRIIQRNTSPIRMYCHSVDLPNSPVDERGDIVIAYNIIERVAQQRRALEKIATSVKVGGILSTTFRVGMNDTFEKREEGLYLRIR